MKGCIIIILFITEMSDDKILLDEDMEVGHGNHRPPTEPPTHQPNDQQAPPPTNQPDSVDQPSTQQQPNPQPEPQPDHDNNVPGFSNNMPAGRGRGVNTGLYIYTGLLFTKLPMHKIDRTRMNEGWGWGR